MTTYTLKNTIVNPRHPYAGNFNVDQLTSVGWTIENLVDQEYLIPISTILDYSFSQYRNPLKANGERLHIAAMSMLCEDGAITRNQFETHLSKYLENYLNREGSNFKVAPPPETTGNTDKINTPYSVLREAMVNDEYNLPKQILGRMTRKPEGRRFVAFTPRHKVSPFDGYDRKVAAAFVIPEGHDPDPFTEKQFNTDLRRRFKVRPSKLFNGTPIHVVIDDVAYENYELSVAYKELGL